MFSTKWPMIHMGKIEDFSCLSGDDQQRVHRTFSNYQQVQSLLCIAETYTTLPNAEMEEILKESIHQAGRGVAETFFNQHSANAEWGERDFSESRDDLAVTLISSDLTKVSVHSFNKVTNGPLARSNFNSLVEGANGKEMGQSLLVEELKRKHGFQVYLENRGTWLPKLETILEDEVYINGTLLKQLTEEIALPVKMKLFFLKVLGSNKLSAITKKWESLSNVELVQPAIDFVEKENYLSFVTGWLNSSLFLGAVVTACNKANTKSWMTPLPTPYLGPPIVTDHVETTYGDAVRSWIDSGNGPKAFGLRTGVEPDNIIKQSHTKSSVGCFLAGTNVLLSNLNETTIEHLKEHDQIVGFGGGLGLISSEKVVQILETETAIYGFNDEDPFFLASHPFWTQDGWRAVNPHLAKCENGWLAVGQLTEGDFVRKVKSFESGTMVYEWMRVDVICSKNVPEGTKVYGVHTREGPRSYHANGFVVLENYPEITTQRAIDGMDKLSFAEREKLHNHLSELGPILSKVLGPGPAKAMSSLAKRYAEKKLNQPLKHNAEKIALKEVSLPHVNLHYQAGKTKLDAYSMPSKLSLVRGNLFLDDAHVPNATISDLDKLSWSRPVSDGKWEHGSVKLHGNRLQGHGFISLTQNFNDTQSQLSANFVAAAHVNNYKCYRSSTPEKAGDSKTDKWIDFGKLSMGTDCTSGSCKPVGQIMIPPNMSELDSLDDHVIFSVDKKFQLSVNVVVPTDYQEPLGYTNLTGVFSMDFSTFSGTCIKYDKNKVGFQGEKYGWKGVIEKNMQAESMLSFARGQSLKSKIHSHKQSSIAALTTPVGMSSSTSTDAVDGIAPMAINMTALADQHLSVDELFMITPPDAHSVQEQTFDLLKQGMEYTMNSDNRANILGVVKPDLSGDMASAAEQYKTFLGERFANAYLMKGLSESEHFKGKITDEQKNKLLYFWAGDGKGCLSQDSDYNRVNNEVSRIAYIQECPDIEKYVTSSEGGLHWAQQLYTKLMDPGTFNGLALTAEISETLSVIQKQTMVLFCLSPDHDYGAKFYRKIMMSRLNEMNSYFVGSKKDEKTMNEVIKDSIKQLIVKILSGGDDVTKQITKELHKDLNDAAKELNVEITDNAEETAQDFLGHMETFIDNVILLFNNQSGTAWQKLTASTAKWLEENPVKAAVGKFFSVAICQGLWITSIVFTIKTFMGWSSLRPEQKVSLIADTVDITVKSLAMVPDLIQNFKSSCTNGKVGFKFIKNWLKAKKNPDEIEMPLLKSVEKVEEVDEIGVDEAMFASVSDSMEDVTEMVTGWQRFFNVADTLAKGTGLIAGAAGCVVIGFQIYNDFKSGAPVAQKALDICQGITIGVATLAAAVGVFVELTVIPIIGIVCAIIGIALAIASLCVKRDPPKPKPTKTDLYVEGPGSTFVNGLTSPSKQWLDNYHKKHDSSS